MTGSVRYFDLGSQSWKSYTGQAPIVPGFVPEYSKPNTSNVGAGVLRATPTVHMDGAPLNGDVSNASILDKIITGWFQARAANILIENAIINAAAIRNGSNLWLANGGNAGNTGLKLRYSTIYSDFGGDGINGIGWQNFTAEYCRVYNVVDGFSVYPYPTAGAAVNAFIRYCLVGPLTQVNPDTTTTSHTSGTHNDPVQVQGGTNWEIVGSTLLGLKSSLSTDPSPIQTTSAIILNSGQGGPVGTIRRNWLDGGGYAINGLGVTGAQVDIIGNRYGRQSLYGPIGVKDAGNTWNIPLSGPDANVYEDNGAPVSVYHA